MKFILTLFLAIGFIPLTFAQITEQYPVQVLEAQKEKQAYSWQMFVISGTAIGMPNSDRPVSSPISLANPKFGHPTSFRLQAGMLKKWGFYVAGTTNFNFPMQSDGDYGENEGDYEFTGNIRYSRWIFQAGPVVHLNPNLMMYFGMGFGKSSYTSETVDGLWMWSHHHNVFSDWTLLEADIGIAYRIKSLIISTGFSSGTTGTRWYSATNIGLGIMF